MNPVMRQLDENAAMPAALYLEAERIRQDATARHADETQAQREERLLVHRSVPSVDGD